MRRSGCRARLLGAVLAVTIGVSTHAGAACLSKSEARSAIREANAVQLADVIATIRNNGYGEVIRANLCYHNSKLYYDVTALAGDGTSRRVRVEAWSGRIGSAN